MKTHKISHSVNLPPEVEQVLAVLDQSGFFDDGLLVGSWVMPFYLELYGIEYYLRTDDMDFALGPEVLRKKRSTDIEAALSAEGVSPIMDSLTGLQKFLSGTFGLEFLIQRKGGRDEIVSVSRYNIHAQPLPFLDLLFLSPVGVETDRFTVKIPSPETLFLHKLIIAQRRKKESKKLKDLEQCSIMAAHLEPAIISELAKAYTMSRTTIQNIRKSCDSIGIPTDFLSQQGG
jgi:hypothetical protein